MSCLEALGSSAMHAADSDCMLVIILTHWLIGADAVQAAKQRKLAEMAAHGIPEKYRAELARYRPMT